MTTAERITGVVLAGGRGVRLGGPKAGVLLKGRPLLDHVLDAISVATTDLIVVSSALHPLPAIHHPNVHVLIDGLPDQGPLLGLVTAFEHTRDGIAIVVGCDMPFLSAPLLANLASLLGADGDTRDAVVPVVESRLQPLCAVYRPAPAARAAADALGADDRSMTGLLSRLRVRQVPESGWTALDPTGRSFFNINTPEDLSRAASLG
jgi:molybdopterin-guanine dinucleotide biosynthesis protein A